MRSGPPPARGRPSPPGSPGKGGPSGAGTALPAPGLTRERRFGPGMEEGSAGTPFLPPRGRWMPPRQANLRPRVWVWGGEKGIAPLFWDLSNLSRLACNKKEATRLERPAGGAEGKGCRRHPAKSRCRPLTFPGRFPPTGTEENPLRAVSQGNPEEAQPRRARWPLAPPPPH